MRHTFIIVAVTFFALVALAKSSETETHEDAFQAPTEVVTNAQTAKAAVQKTASEMTSVKEVTQAGWRRRRRRRYMGSARERAVKNAARRVEQAAKARARAAAERAGKAARERSNKERRAKAGVRERNAKVVEKSQKATREAFAKATAREKSAKNSAREKSGKEKASKRVAESRNERRERMRKQAERKGKNRVERRNKNVNSEKKSKARSNEIRSKRQAAARRYKEQTAKKHKVKAAAARRKAKEKEAKLVKVRAARDAKTRKESQAKARQKRKNLRALRNKAHKKLKKAVRKTLKKLKKGGASNADCVDLANTMCKTVEKEVSTDQTLINNLKDGKQCVNLGLKAVRTATAHLVKTRRIQGQWKVKVSSSYNARINFGYHTFSSLREGKCGQFFTSRSYRTASHRYRKNVKIEASWRGRVKEATRVLIQVKLSRKRQVKRCHCATKRARSMLWRTVTKRSRMSRQIKAHAKCKMLKCVLKGTSLRSRSRKCRASLKRLVNRKLIRATETVRGCGGKTKRRTGFTRRVVTRRVRRC